MFGDIGPKIRSGINFHVQQVQGFLSTLYGGTGASNIPTDGHLLIGSTANANYTDGAVTSSANSVAITTGSGTLNLETQTYTAHAVIIGRGSAGFNASTTNPTVGVPFVSGGSSADGSYSALPLATSGVVSGILPIANGGTGTSNGFVTGLVINNCRLYGATGAPYGNASGNANTITSLFFGPCSDRGEFITLDNGSGVLSIFTVSEISLSLSSGFTTATMYDAYVYNNSGTLTLDTAAWGGINTPPTRSTDAAGRLTKSGATARLLIGSFYMLTSTTTADAAGNRLVNNVYNQVNKRLFVTGPATSWTYATNTWRPSDNNTTGSQMGFVAGSVEVSHISATMQETLSPSGGTTAASIGPNMDSTTAAPSPAGTLDVGSGVNNATLSVVGVFIPSPGYHYLQGMEIVTVGTMTFVGTGSYELSALVPC